MSGVVYLLSIQDVYAQVPQTKRSEQDSFLKNIRAKKRNNDLQKARRAKGRSNQKKSNKIRFKVLLIMKSQMKMEKKMDMLIKE